MASEQPVASLRRVLLAVSVIDDIDVLATDTGVILGNDVVTHLSWREIGEAVGPHAHDTEIARIRLATSLRLRNWVATRGHRAKDELRPSARLLALNPAHALHPGPDWVRGRVLGGALDCGIGLVGEAGNGADAVPLPCPVAEAAQIDQDDLYIELLDHARAMGELAVARLHRDDPGRRPITSASDSQAVLRPVGGLDVPSLLATTPVRSYLAHSDGSGMRGIAVPIRSRGWYDLARIDPAFVQAAWAASAESERGLQRSLLVTVDEVTLGPSGHNVINLALSDPATERSGVGRSVRFR